MGIYSGSKHTLGYWLHRNWFGVFALLLSSDQIFNMKHCAGLQVLFQIFAVANTRL